MWLQEPGASSRHGRTSDGRADEALGAANRRTASILESVTDAFYAFDADWRFTYVNRQAERLLRRPREEMLGRIVWEEFPEAVGTRP